MTTVAASVKARGHSQAESRCREQRREGDAGRTRGVHLTAQGRSAADPFAGRLHGQCQHGLSGAPACAAVPEPGSRTGSVLSSEAAARVNTAGRVSHEERTHDCFK